jgi:hypothetical protein
MSSCFLHLEYEVLLYSSKRYILSRSDQKCRPSILLRRRPRASPKLVAKGLSKSALNPDTLKAFTWSKGTVEWRPSHMSQGLESIPRLLELETAKQILEEVFHARSLDIEDMIHRWLEERNCSEESCGRRPSARVNSCGQKLRILSRPSYMWPYRTWKSRPSCEGHHK